MNLALLASIVGLLPSVQAPQEEGAPRRGLILAAEGAFDGLTVLAPIASRTIHLVDTKGEVVHSWESPNPAAWAQLLENGNLLTAGEDDEPSPRFEGPGVDGGLLQELDWEGNVIWRYAVNDDYQLLHHDVDRLPNGNLMFLVWEHRYPEDAIEWGRDPSEVGEQGMWVDAVLEIRPGDGEAEVVWEWHAWDHIVQDFDDTKANHGSISAHPGRIDLNADHRGAVALSVEELAAQRELEEQMAALGYGGDSSEAGAEIGAESGGVGMRGSAPDWLHTNAVTYHPEADLIVLSTPRLNELWVIDHSTTTEEAAGDTGGRYGRGGDLLWRWGNPKNYGAGTAEDQRLFFQHDPTWVPGETPDELRLMVFNNGRDRPDGEYSSVLELVLPWDADQGFQRAKGQPFGPAEPAWSYRLPEDCFSSFISGARRLPNGNVLICSGAPGRILEVTRDGKLVWDYENPFGGEEDLQMPNPPPRNSLYRATRVARDHPGLAGRDL